MVTNIFQWRSLKTRVTLVTLAIFIVGIWSLPPVPTGMWQQLGLDEIALLTVFKNTEKQFASTSLVVDT